MTRVRVFSNLVFCAGRLRQGWAETTCTHGLEENVAGRVRAHQMRSLFRLSPVMMLATAVNSGVLAYTFYPIDPVRALLWLACIGIFLAVQLRIIVRNRKKPLPRSVSPRTIFHAMMYAAMLAVIWGAVPVLFFSEPDLERMFLLAALSIGMFCGGAVSLATIPRAALIYSAIMGTAILISLFNGPERLFWSISVMYVAFFLIICMTVMTLGRQTARNVIDQQLLVDTATAQRLLRKTMRERESQATEMMQVNRAFNG